MLFQPSLRWIYINDPSAQTWGTGLHLPGSRGAFGNGSSLQLVSAGIKWDPIDTDFSFHPQWERLWFLILTSSFFLTLVWFYFWWEVHNDYNEINWWVELPLGNLVAIIHLLVQLWIRLDPLDGAVMMIKGRWGGKWDPRRAVSAWSMCRWNVALHLHFVAGFLFVYLDGWLDLKVTEQFGCNYSTKYPWQKFSLKHMGVENIIQSWKELKRSFAVGCAGI